MFSIIKEFYFNKYRIKIGKMFKRYLNPSKKDKILDLGSASGEFIASTLPYRNSIYLADINDFFLKKAQIVYRYKHTILIDPLKKLPFPDKFFDIVISIGVIDHATGNKLKVLKCSSNKELEKYAYRYQKKFASEIRRVGKRYFVTTPNKYFPIESHTLMPVLFVFLPRWLQIHVIKFLNKWWPMKSFPDWNLLDFNQMKELFPDSQIIANKFYGFTRSLIAVKNKNQ